MLHNICIVLLHLRNYLACLLLLSRPPRLGGSGREAMRRASVAQPAPKLGVWAPQMTQRVSCRSTDLPARGLGAGGDSACFRGSTGSKLGGGHHRRLGVPPATQPTPSSGTQGGR
uniref:Secreted protein n=1 Tax=Setaria viridis TaxID=4556 RepID=A0A4U6T1C8_SETVI|nr:hypothetical protein SEVIR_9G353500v2 [Setaria viridis]